MNKLIPYTIPCLKQYKNGKRKLIGVKNFKWFATPHRTIIVTKSGEYQDIKYEVFNPGSRSHIRKWLEDDLGYSFPYYTPSGQEKVDPESLEGLEHTSGKRLKRYLEVVKDLSMVGTETPSGWLNNYNEATHSIHHRVDLIGAVTHRATHSSPNLAQVPADHKFRELFSAPPGRVVVGADLKNIEIRVLAHYLAEYDNGKYASAVLSKDMHWYHAKLAGFWTKDDCDWDENTATKDMVTARKASKAFFFGYLYGQGDTIRGHNLWKPGCLTSYTKKEYSTAKQKIERRLINIDEVKFFPLKKDQYVPYEDALILKTIYGKQVADTFLKNLTGIKDLIKDCQTQSKNKSTVTAIDNRELYSKSAHSALNLLLQGSAGVIAKKWMANYHDLAADRGIPHGKRWSQMAYVHDEYQCQADEPVAVLLGDTMVDSCAMIQGQFNTNIPIEADYMIGKDWSETH